MAITEVTLGEVYRLMTAQGATLAAISQSLEHRPTWDDLTRMEAARLEREKLTAAREVLAGQAVKDLQDAQRWLVRTVAGTLLTALAAAAGVVINAASLAGR